MNIFTKFINLDMVKISKKYIPKETEKYMCAKHLAFFKQKLTDWKKDLKRTNNEEKFLKDFNKDFYQYFVHSYSVKSKNYKRTKSIYEFEFGGENFIAAAKNKNTVGVQFHPERSGVMGLELLKAILRKV